MAPNSSFGYDFEDSQTRAQLELIDDLHKLGVSNYIDLPQSTGKSSVLQAVTEIPFSVDDEICTRFATEIVLRRSGTTEPTTVDVTIIPDQEESADRKKSLLAWRPKGFDAHANLNKSTVKEIFQQAQKIIFAESDKKNNIIHGRCTNLLSSSILRITRSGPIEPNFTIVDIPGLVRGNESNLEHRTSRKLVQDYLKNSRSIIVVVVDVVDLVRHEIFQLLHEVPDYQTRTIGVMNKCDMKQKKSHDWVLNLIRNNPTESPEYLKEGWYGLRNRLPSEVGVSDEERDRTEEKFFAGEDWKSLDKNKLGRHQLKNALIQMRNRHIKNSIPGILSEIQERLDTCVSKIRSLGEPRTTNQAQYTVINRIATRYSAMAESALNGHYEDLPDGQLFARKRLRDVLAGFQHDMARNGMKFQFQSGATDAELISPFPESSGWLVKFKTAPIYRWISTAIESYRAKEEIGEINPEVKDLLWKQQTAEWKNISSVALGLAERTIESVNAIMFEKACPDNGLRLRLQTWLQEEFQKASLDAKDELERLLMNEREAHLLTLDPRKSEAKQRYHDERVRSMKEKFTTQSPEIALPQAATPPLNVGTVPSEIIISSMIAAESELFGIFNTHDSLAAYYDIALYRFIDNFALQVVERHLLGPRGPLRLFNSDYVTRNLYGRENEKALNALASEDPDTAQKRTDLETERTSLEGSKRRVQNFKLL